MIVETAPSQTVPVERMDEMFVRNVDVISADEQAAIGASHVLIAGCGSVGGSLVESLVRLGATRAVIADPEVFDFSNLNRQACSLADVGRPKVAVLAERARAINPHFDVRVLPEGLTEENIERALDGVSIAFDGIDAASSPWVKYRLHEIAAQRRIPVIAGFDFGGKACLYVFDYRRRRRKPFYGRATAKAHRQGDLAQCVKWLGYRHFPTDFLGVIQDRLETGKPWPQVAYCVQAMGALATRAVVDLSVGRQVPHVVSFDVHDAMRSPLGRAVQLVKFPLALARAFRASRRGRQQPTARPAVARATEFADRHFHLRRVLDSMICAPSAHNCQPWHFTIQNATDIQIGYNPVRVVPAVDPEGLAIAYSLGCAIEAAFSVADVEFIPATPSSLSADRHIAGTLRVRSLKAAGYTRGFSLLQRRVTHRGALLDVPLAHGLAPRCDMLAASAGAHAVLRRLPAGAMFELTRHGAKRLFKRDDYVAELVAHIRLSEQARTQTPTGFTPESLGLSLGETVLLRMLQRAPALLAALGPLGLSATMVRSAVREVQSHSTYVVVAATQWTDAGRIDAGRALMRVWLELTDQGLHCQPVDFPISTDEGRKAVSRLFGLPGTQRPIALLRVGRAVDMPPRSPRLPLDAVCSLAPAAAEAGMSTGVTVELEPA